MGPARQRVQELDLVSVLKTIRLRALQGLWCAAALLVSGCVTPREPLQTVTGTYLAGRLAARVNDTRTAAENFSMVQSVAPGNSDLRYDTFLYRLLSGDHAGAVTTARRIEHAASIASVQTPGSPLGGTVPPLVAITLSADDLRAERFDAARKHLSLIEDGSIYRALVFLLQGWTIAGDDGPAAGIAHLKNPPTGLFTGFSPLHLAMMAEAQGNDAEARASYQLSFFTLGGPVGRRKFADYLVSSGDEAAAREANSLLLNQRGPMRRIGLRNLERLDKNGASGKATPTSAREGAAIAFYTFGAAIAEQIYNQRENAEQAGFELRPPDLTQPMIMTQLALMLSPELYEAQRFLGTLNNINTDYDAAIAALSKIPPRSSYHEQAQIEIANAHIAKDDDGVAVDVLEALIARDRNAQEAPLVLSALYARQEDYQKAVDILDPVITAINAETYPESWRFYVSRADAYLNLDEWSAGEADLKKAVELAPEEPTTLNYLGYSWAERGVNLDQAFDLLQQAVEKEPRSGAIIDSVGWAHYQRGNYDEALTNLEKAVSLEPDDPTLTDHLGDVYWVLGRRIEARYEWRRALALDPDPALKRKLGEKLADGLPEKSPAQ
ncbi:MAG: tetratricopeptide repeat protein [Pseudomonadota bacterium]